ncbi:MAG: efflux RND transporter permease subunit [Myxococcales bacterium]|nr:efflux RND transporter permease subunit [Myxococcales bacterium]
MTLYAHLRRHAATLALITVALAVAGVLAGLHLPSGIYPEVDFPRIVVVARGGDAPADVTAATVTRPLEASVATVPGVRRVRSRSSRGASEIDLTFVDGTDMARALSMVQARAEETRGELPDGAELAVERLTPVAFPVVTFNLTGPLDGADLHDLAENVVRPALSRVDGVGRVDVLGGDLREVEVLVDPGAAAALRLDVPAIARLVGETAHRSTAGLVPVLGEALTVEADALPLDAAALARIPVAVVDGAPVPLRAVARVEEGVADRTAMVSGPGGETVLVSVARMEGASTPAVAGGAIEAARALASELPAGVRLTPVYDQAALVDDAIASVRDAILLGILLCLGVLGLLLRDLRAGLVAGLAVPLTLSITFGLMWLGGQTLDLMSLGGMAVAIGLVVDDAIVVVEAISRRLEEGMSPDEAAEAGLRDLFAAVVGTTFTTVVVFAPMGLVSGVVGRFLGALAWTLSAAVVVSLVVAVTVVPLVAGRLLRARPHRVSRLDRAYGSVLRAAVRRRGLAVSAALALGVVGVVAWSRVETGFLPSMDEGGFVLDYFMPAGTSLQRTAEVASRIEAVLAEVPEVETWSVRTGAELGPAAATEASRGDVMVRLRRERDRGCEEVMEDVRGRLEEQVPEARVELIQVLQDVLADLAGASHPVEIELHGSDLASLQRAAAEVEARLAGTDGLADLYGGVEIPSPSLRFAVDPAAAARLGWTSVGVADLLSASVAGVVPIRLPYLDRTVGVRVRAPDAVRFDPVRLASLPLVPPDATIPVTTLSSVATAHATVSPTEVDRQDQRLVVTVTAEQEGRDLGSLMAEVRSRLADVHLPPGVALRVAGAWAEQRRSSRELVAVMSLAVAAVGTVLVAQFRGFRVPALVLLTAPVALVGAVLTLWALGVPLNASSGMGLILLVGLVVKNGILLLEHAEALRDQGLDPVEAVVAAGERRLRPILLTTTCTVFGLLPLALGVGAGSELQQPLAVAVIGGLTVSTLVSLVLLPVLAVRRRAA